MKKFLSHILSSIHARTALAFLVLGLVVFSNSLNNDFMMDDYAVIFTEKLKEEPQNFWKHFLPQYQHGMAGDRDAKYAYFRPWAHAPVVLMYHFFQDNPLYYHMFCLLLFLSAVWVIYLFIYYILGNWLTAFLAGVFCLIHPMNGLLVNYITAYVFSLQMVFIFVGLILAVRGFDGKHKIALAGALFLHFNALLCHETAFAFPIYLTLVLWFFRSGGWPRILRFTAFFWILDIAYFVFRMFFASLKSGLLDNVSLMYLSFLECAGVFAKLVAWYLQGLVTLQKIVLIKVAEPPVFWAWYAVAGALVIALVLLIRAVRKKHAAVFCGLWLAAGFVPVIPAAFFQYHYGLMLEPHWLMVSSVGYYLFIAWCFVRLLNLVPKMPVIVMLGIFVFSCVVQTFAYNRLWGNEPEYCAVWRKESPSLTLIPMLQANAYVHKEQNEAALEMYLQAAQEICDDPDLYFKLALIEGGALKNLDKAKEYLLRALSMDPDSATALHKLGIVYLNLDKDEKKAEEMFRRALSYSRGFVAARKSLVHLYTKQQRFSEAWDLLSRQRAAYPKDAYIYSSLIDLALKTSRFDALASLVNEYVNLEKKAGLMLKTAILLAKYGQSDLALKCFRRVLELDPSFKNGYMDAGQFLASIGRFDDALNLWREGQRRYPKEPAFGSMIDQINLLKAQPSHE